MLSHMLVNAKKQIQAMKGKLLLALSGGPDSMALFYLFLECKKDFAIAHVDHNLREESVEEKQILARMAKKAGVPFYSSTLSGVSFEDRNLEATLRTARYQFFQQIMKEHEFDFLCLGHQRDEKSETVIKRFFEGSSLLNLYGLQAKSSLYGMKIFRPLIDTPKIDILQFLQSRSAQYFIDQSNIEGDNLRAKMRRELIPHLEKSFGKNIQRSICDIASQAHDCKQYIEREILKIGDICKSGPFGEFYPFTQGVDPFIFFQFIQLQLKSRGEELSFSQREFLKKSIFSHERDKKIELSSFSIFFETEGLFFCCEDKLEVQVASVHPIHWKEFWEKGVLHEGVQRVSKEKYACLLKTEKHYEKMREKKVPVFFRKAMPISLTKTIEKINI